jgi:trehalose 6-phosphate phosphatase
VTTPAAVAAAVASAPRPFLVAVDVDGTISMIVAHPADAVLIDGARSALARLAAIDGIVVGVVSGRPLYELRGQFGFDDHTRLIGSHGLEDSSEPTPALTADERRRLDALRRELQDATADVPGAWVEDKPLSAVLHVGQVPRSQGDAILAHAEVRLGERVGLYLVPGHRGLEVAIRPASKRPAVERLRTETGARAVVYIGDDITDEQVLATLRPPDIGVRVGDRPSAAPWRLAGPAEVVELLDAVADRLGGSS